MFRPTQPPQKDTLHRQRSPFMVAILSSTNVGARLQGYGLFHGLMCSAFHIQKALEPIPQLHMRCPILEFCGRQGCGCMKDVYPVRVGIILNVQVVSPELRSLSSHQIACSIPTNVHPTCRHATACLPNLYFWSIYWRHDVVYFFPPGSLPVLRQFCEC